MPSSDTQESIDIRSIEKNIGYVFTDKNLLLQALTHRSYTNEHKEENHNERLEFLGDAVLQFITTQKLYILYPDTLEGELSMCRSLLVKTNFLVTVAETLELPKYLRVSTGQKKDLKTVSTALFADAVEAIIGAVHLDGGLKAAETFIFKKVLVNIQEHLSQMPLQDAKTELQEYTQQELDITPEYIVLHEAGPDHAKIFTIGVKIGDAVYAEASGKSKQEAAQKAAQKALDKYKNKK